MATVVMKCKCVHKAQDEFHGKGVRVFNSLAKAKGGDQQLWRCTVCGVVEKKSVTA